MARQHKQRFNKQRTQLGGWNAVLRIFLEPPNQKHKPPMQQLTMSHAEHASSLEHVKPTRENNGVPDPRKQLHGSSRSATYANRRGKPVSYTQAAEATVTNNENEPRRAALNMKPARESDGAPTPRKKLNGSSRSATYATEVASPSRTHIFVYLY